MYVCSKCCVSVPIDVSGVPSGSIIILYQLQDKLEAHNRYIQFLTDVGLLDKVFVTGHWVECVSFPSLWCDCILCILKIQGRSVC